MSASGNFAERFFESGFREVADLIGELDSEDFAGGVFFDDTPDGTADVAVEDECDGGGCPEDESGKNVGEEDADGGDDIGDELGFSFLSHLLEQSRVGEFRAGEKEDCSEGCEGDAAEKMGCEECGGSEE